MEQEKILNLILDKLENIEKEQKIIKNQALETNKRLNKIEDGQDIIRKDINDIKSVQETIKEFMLSTEKAIEEYERDHKFIEKIRKVAGE